MRTLVASALSALVFGFSITSAHADTNGASSVDEQPRRLVPPKYQTLRYLEDYRYLAGTKGEDPFDPIKYIPIGEHAWLTLGGQHRLRYELVEGRIGGADSPERTSVMLVRNLVHADIHAGRHLRLFAQVGSHLALGQPGAEPPDADIADVQQLFAETTAHAGAISVTTRVGRQEMTLGSTRWVSVRDGTNMHQAFDLVRVTTSGQRFSGETFLGSVPASRRGVLDDAFDAADRFFGSYWTVQAIPDKRLSFDVYYLGRARAIGEYADARGPETRHMIGTRIFGQLGRGPEYIVHAIAQTGAVGATTIRAWGLAGALWQRLPDPLAGLRLGLRTDALSGDSRSGDGRLGTFHAFFPNQTFFSALPLIYPSNLYEAHPLLSWDAGAVAMEAGCIFFFRQSVDDAVYGPPGVVLVAPAISRERYTGAQTSISLAYRATRHITVNMEHSHVFVGPGLAATTGRDIDFFGTWTTFTY